MNLGYLVGTLIFAAMFVAEVLAQIPARRFHPAVYWTTIIASTTLGTTLADFADRSLGSIGDWTADSAGGLALSRYAASAVLLGFIALCVLIVPQRAATEAH